MIIDVHTHIPTHRDSVPIRENITDSTIGSGAAINVTGSVNDYLESMKNIDRAIVFGVARQPGRDEPPILDWRQGWPEDFNQNDPFYRLNVWARETIRIHPFLKRRGWDSSD